MAVASAGSYASLYLAPDRQPHQHLTTQFFTGRMPFLPLNQQRQSTEGTSENTFTKQCAAVSTCRPYSLSPPVRVTILWNLWQTVGRNPANPGVKIAHTRLPGVGFRS